MQLQDHSAGKSGEHGGVVYCQYSMYDILVSSRCFFLQFSCAVSNVFHLFVYLICCLETFQD